MDDENFQPALEREIPAAQFRPEVVAVVQHNHQQVTVFDGSNALDFVMAFENFARHQGFWDLVIGERARPRDGEASQREWDRSNAQALNSLR